MITRFKQEHVKPGERIDLRLGDRLTILTGEGGTGKSRLLDSLWHVASGTWPGETNTQIDGSTNPWNLGEDQRGRIGATIRLDDGTSEIESTEGAGGRWETRRAGGDPPATVYAHANGAVSVCAAGRAVSMTARQAWEGNREQWASEQPERVWPGIGNAMRNGFHKGLDSVGRLATMMREAIPLRYRHWTAGRPDLLTELLASRPQQQAAMGGIARWVTISCMMHWAAELQRDAAERTGLLLLVDEVEAHLHPSWQTEVLARAVATAAAASDENMQVVATTTSAAVLGGMRDVFDTRQDRLARLDYDGADENNRARVLTFRRHATIGGFFTDPAIGMESERVDHNAQQAVDTIRDALADVGPAEPDPAEAEAAGPEHCYSVADPTQIDLRPAEPIEYPTRVYHVHADAAEAARCATSRFPDKTYSVREHRLTPVWATERVGADAAVSRAGASEKPDQDPATTSR